MLERGRDHLMSGRKSIMCCFFDFSGLCMNLSEVLALPSTSAQNTAMLLQWKRVMISHLVLKYKCFGSLQKGFEFIEICWVLFFFFLHSPLTSFDKRER